MVPKKNKRKEKVHEPSKGTSDACGLAFF